MNIIVLHPFIRPGGAESVMLKQCAYLQEEGLNITIVTAYIEGNSSLDISGIDIVSSIGLLNSYCIKYKLIRQIFGSIIMMHLLLKHSKKSNLIFSHNSPSHLIAIMTKFWHKQKIIWMCNEPPKKILLRNIRESSVVEYLSLFLLDSFVERLLVNKYIDRILVLDEKNKEIVKERYKRESYKIYSPFDKPKHTVINNAVSSIIPKLRLVIIGTLHYRRRVDIAIDLCYQLNRKGFFSELHIVGDGPFRKNLESQTISKGIGDQVIFHGFVSDSEKRRIIQYCHVTLLCAENQSWGLTPIESLQLGRISIVSKDCGVSEILMEHKSGYVYDGSLSMLISITLSVISDYGSKEYFQMINNGYKMIENVLSVDAYTARLKKHFHQTLEE